MKIEVQGLDPRGKRQWCLLAPVAHSRESAPSLPWTTCASSFSSKSSAGGRSRRTNSRLHRAQVGVALLVWSLGMTEIAHLDTPTGETPDVELLRRIAGGDVDAFGQFYDRHSTLLLSIAAKVLRDVHEAEEVLQDAARLVWESAPLYDPALGKPASWAVVITRNKAIDRLRVLQRRSDAIARLTEEVAADFSQQPHATPGEALARETTTLLRGALATLPSDQRLAIELAFFTGLSQTEVAAQLGVPLGTIKARIRRGMLAMRDVLEEQL